MGAQDNEAGGRVADSGKAESSAEAAERQCGACSLCCTVLRVDELGKLAGTPCRHQRLDDPRGGCGIHASRPGICRRYRCLWLGGSLAEDDRPDRLGAVLSLASDGLTPTLFVHEARPGAFDASPRLQAIAERFRTTVPVRIAPAADVLNPDRPHRLLLADGEEHRIEGAVTRVYRDGALVETRRLSALERGFRRLTVALQRWHLASAARRAH